jgi:hypothetical protein
MKWRSRSDVLRPHSRYNQLSPPTKIIQPQSRPKFFSGPKKYADLVYHSDRCITVPKVNSNDGFTIWRIRCPLRRRRRRSVLHLSKFAQGKKSEAVITEMSRDS